LPTVDVIERICAEATTRATRRICQRRFKTDTVFSLAAI